MGVCIYCGQSAGLFRRKHRTCEVQYSRAWELLIGSVDESIRSGEPFDGLSARIAEIAASGHLDEEAGRRALVRGWERSLEAYLEDDLLSEKEDARLTGFARALGVASAALNANGGLDRLEKARVLRSLEGGALPALPAGAHPFHLQKSERLAWLFRDVEYFEERTMREYRGSHQSVSFRVTRGVYYRVGAFRGHPVDTSETVHVDTGLLGVTTKHLYFGGGTGRSFRIRFSKIVALDPYSNGIGVHRDAASAKPQLFVTGDGWFTLNLVQRLSRLHDEGAL